MVKLSLSYLNDVAFLWIDKFLIQRFTTFTINLLLMSQHLWLYQHIWSAMLYVICWFPIIGEVIVVACHLKVLMDHKCRRQLAWQLSSYNPCQHSLVKMYSCNTNCIWIYSCFISCIHNWDVLLHSSIFVM